MSSVPKMNKREVKLQIKILFYLKRCVSNKMFCISKCKLKWAFVILFINIFQKIVYVYQKMGWFVGYELQLTKMRVWLKLC